MARIDIDGVTFQSDGDGVTVTAGAGLVWDDLVAQAVARGLTGVECLSGIPGTVGATPIQNVGAYGQEIRDVLVAVTCLDRETFERVTFTNEACEFAYRTSRFKGADRGRYVVLDVTLRSAETFTIPTGILSLLEEPSGFHTRKANGRGEFVDREQLARWQSRQLSDVLRQVSGVRVEPRVPNSPGAGRFRIRMTRTPATCQPIAYLDGAFLGSTALFDVDAVVSVDALLGIEVYRGLGEVPAEFDVPGAQCGVVVMWTDY